MNINMSTKSISIYANLFHINLCILHHIYMVIMQTLPVPEITVPSEIQDFT